MRYSISEILKKADSMPTKEEKIKILRDERSPSMRDVLSGTYDDRVKWLLPAGDIAYKKNNLPDQEGMLIQQTRTFYIYVEINGEPQSPVTQLRREVSFIQLLESLSAQDAELMMHVKDKKLPYASLTRELINDAFPGLLYIAPLTNVEEPVSLVEETKVRKLNSLVKRVKGRPRKTNVKNQKSA